MYAVKSKLFWEYYGDAVPILGSATIFFIMQLHLPYLSWDSFEYTCAAFNMLGHSHLVYAAAVLELYQN